MVDGLLVKGRFIFKNKQNFMAKKEEVKKVLEDALESGISKKEIEKILKEKSPKPEKKEWLPNDIFSLIMLSLITVLSVVSLVFNIVTYKNTSGTITKDSTTKEETKDSTVASTEETLATTQDFSEDEELTDKQKLNLANCLKEKGVKVYFASWCGYCQAQHQSFGDDAWNVLDKVQCDTEDGGWTQECTDAGVQGVPTWIFSDGTNLPGRQALKTLAEKAGCQL